jgi:hypothetical protein
VVLHVEDAGGLVGPFEVFAELDEFPALAPRIGRGGETLEEMGGSLDVVEKIARAGGPDFRGGALLHVEVELVDRLPHLEGNLVADHPGVLARRKDARENRIRVAPVEREEVRHAAAISFAVAFFEPLLVARRGEDRAPMLLDRAIVEALEIEQELEIDVEQPREVFGPLDVAAHPVERVRDPREHHGRLRAEERRSGGFGGGHDEKLQTSTSRRRGTTTRKDSDKSGLGT